MSDFLGTLCNTRLLRAALKDAELPALELGLNKLKEIINEHRQYEEERRRRAAQKIEVVNNIKSLLSSNNLTLNDLSFLLANNEPAPRTTKRNVTPKYKFTDANGQECFWTGQGRTPKAFTECQAREHKTANDYLIIKEAEA